MSKKKILVLDKQSLDRQILKDMLSSTYELLEAAKPATARQILQRWHQQIAVVLLDFTISAEVNGYEVLRECKQETSAYGIPVIVLISHADTCDEVKCLKLGASDFIHKPYVSEMVHFRIESVIARNQNSNIKTPQSTYDRLTGLYTKEAFLEKAGEMAQKYAQEQFALVHLDINQFQILNQLYGFAEGDRLLTHISKLLMEMANRSDHFICARYRADIFFFCMPYKEQEDMCRVVENLCQKIRKFRMEQVVFPAVGIYVMNSPDENISICSDKANLAAKSCKGNYIKNYAFYDSAMSERMIQRQKIINSMDKALQSGQFQLYIQPKYDLTTNHVNGGEVLVRWVLPDKSAVPPSEFIPVFEQSGFIMKLDYYVWDQACQIIRRWLDEGKKPYPISVNISRVSLYNPKLTELICGLVEKYEIEPRLLQLELTESAYTDNPDEIKDSMQYLHDFGFSILIDDFGSGYSSLNSLKDIVFDILKIDMKFFSKTDQPGRGENILASVVRMAKWLNMPVIAEGVEKESQVAFLRSIGCEFVQGYYFAKPMPVAEYEHMAFGSLPFHSSNRKLEGSDANQLWDVTAQMEILFSNMLQAVAIYEYVPEEEIIDTIRVNNSYYDLFGCHDFDEMSIQTRTNIDPEYREVVFNTFAEVTRTKDIAQCEFRYTQDNGRELWVEIKLKYINSIGNRNVIFAIMSDISDRKDIEQELHKYRDAILTSESKVETILIVDDIQMNRQILRNMFESEYNIIEACNGLEALKIVKNYCPIDLILLDVMMPVMDGKEFLARKHADIQIAHIPVVVVTADDSPQQQINALSLGANDYVVKPFIPEVVIRRVCNVLASQKHVSEVLQHTCAEQDTGKQTDSLTGLYNRNYAGQIIRKVSQASSGLQALLMIDIHNIAAIHARYGKRACDNALQNFADCLRGHFRKGDILARYSRDEFMIFIPEVPSQQFVEQNCCELLQKVQVPVWDNVKLDCSVGIAMASANDNQDYFMELISHADNALSTAKSKGKNQWSIYEENN